MFQLSVTGTAEQVMTAGFDLNCCTDAKWVRSILKTMFLKLIFTEMT